MGAFITHTVMQGDTLQRIAKRYNVPDWKNLALLNNLKYPFIVDTIPIIHEGRLKYPGDTMLIPATVVESINYVSVEEMEKEVFGSDIYLDFGDSNQVVNLESIGTMIEEPEGDLQKVQGVDNLKQALYLRLMTRHGELTLHPEYGSKFLDMIGRRRLSRELIKMRLELEETFKQDYRVEDVLNAQVVCIPGGVMAECDIICINPKYNFKFSSNVKE